MTASVNRRRLGVLAVFALVAVACGGEAETSDSSPDVSTAVSEPEPEVDDTGVDDTDADPEPDTEADPDPDTEADPEPDTDEGDADFFDDPRGPLFVEYQKSIDRTHPFGSLDALCLPHDAAENREATDAGITADSIEIFHIRSTLEELASIGFGVEVGDVTAMWEALVATVNEECGGVRGRLLDAGQVEFSPIGDPVAETTSACLVATEDNNAVIAVNSSGFQGPAVLCLTEEHETMFITTQGLSQDYADRSDGRLITLDVGLSEGPAFAASIAHDQGLLEGKTIGVVTSDAPERANAIESGQIATLEALGYEVAVFDVIGCGGATACTEGVQESVSNMLTNGVDVIFPSLNILSLPGYISEMVTQGFQPGEVQFIQSSFESQAGDLVSSKVAAFGGEAAAALYNGTFIADNAATGNQNIDDFNPPFNQMCQEAYVAQGGPELDFFDSADNTVVGMLSNLCSIFRMAMRAIYDAGDNPTRADIYEAANNLGPVDTNNMIPGSVAPGKTAVPDAFQTMTWTSPCAFEGGAFDENDTCVVPNGDYVAIR